MDKIEVKFAGSTDESGSFEGYGSVFGNVDGVGDVVERGAFKASLKSHKSAGTRPLLLWMHRPDEPIGTVDELTEDDTGLAIKGRLVLETSRGREAHALLKAGALTGLSIGYRTIKSAQGQGGVRRLQQVDLLEVSLVTMPANGLARVTSVKAADAADQDNPADLAAITEGPHMDEEFKAAQAALTERIDALETEAKSQKDRADALELKLNRPSTGEDNTPKADAKAFLSYIRKGDAGIGADERKDLVASNDPQGGYLAHPQLIAELEKNLIETSPVRAAARVSSTNKGSVILPKRTSGPTAYWVGETEARTETQPAYGQTELPVHELACYVDISNQLLEDADFNLEAELAMDFAEEFGAKEGTAFVSGNGIKKPLGLTNASLTEVANGHATTLAADSLISVLYDLPMFYRSKAVWGMNSSTLAVVRKLKGSDNNYLWQPGLQAGQPETLLGRPVIEMPDMPDIESGSTPIVVGDFSKFRVFDRIGLSVLRDPFTVATSGLVRFHARRRLAAGVTQAEAFRLLSMEV